MSAADLLTEIPVLVGEIVSGTFDVDARAVPLAQVESAWLGAGGDERIVLTP